MITNNQFTHTYLTGNHDVNLDDLTNHYIDKDKYGKLIDENLQFLSHQYHENLMDFKSEYIWRTIVSCTIMEITRDDVFFQKNNAYIIKNIYEDATKIHTILEPLKSMYLKNFEMDIAGGSVRDFLFDSSDVKDHDFIINTQMLGPIIRALDFEQLQNILSKNDLKKYKIDENSIYEKDYLDLTFKLFLWCFEKSEVLDSFYYYGKKFTDVEEYIEFKKTVKIREISDTQDEYIYVDQKRFIIKLKEEKFKRPIDIILYDNNKISFIKNFDISSNQVCIPMIQKGNLLNFEDMNQRVCFSPLFILGYLAKSNILSLENMLNDEHHVIQPKLMNSVKRMHRISQKNNLKNLIVHVMNEPQEIDFAYSLLKTVQEYDTIEKTLKINQEISKKVKL